MDRYTEDVFFFFGGGGLDRRDRYTVYTFLSLDAMFEVVVKRGPLKLGCWVKILLIRDVFEILNHRHFKVLLDV